MPRTVFVILSALLLLPRAAQAQNTPRFGIAMGYPAQVDVVWRLADWLAIRPEINWTRSTTESTATSTVFNGATVTTMQVTTTSESNGVGTGISALIYVAKRDALRTYVAPRFVYARTTNSTDLGIALPTLVPPNPRTTTSNYTVTGSLGAQYDVARHFGVFGEVGFAYGHSRVSPETTLTRSSATSNSYGLRSGAGVILYFGS